MIGPARRIPKLCTNCEHGDETGKHCNHENQPTILARGTKGRCYKRRLWFPKAKRSANNG
jgi:hypothetical protein